MLKRWFPVVAAVALLLTSAGAGRAQFAGILGYGYPGAFGMSVYSGYGVPSSLALSPMSYVAFYPPVYTTRAPVVAPAWPLLPAGQAATVTVLVPFDAVVLFDGHKTSQTGTQRIFTTPTLEKGASYHYLVEARFLRDGKQVSQAQRVPVHAGGATSVTFPVIK